jgi:hypothetical protein
MNWIIVIIIIIIIIRFWENLLLRPISYHYIKFDWCNIKVSYSRHVCN